MERATHEIDAPDIRSAMTRAKAFMETDDYEDLSWEGYEIHGDLNSITVHGPAGSVLEYEAPDFIASIRGKDYLHALRLLAAEAQACLDNAAAGREKLARRLRKTLRLLANAPTFRG
jgi:hypothetical protein